MLRRPGGKSGGKRRRLARRALGEPLMFKRTCAACFCAGICVCGVAWVVGEKHEFGHPAQIYCERQPVGPDFGPPEQCGGDPAPHNRQTFGSAVTVNGSVGSVSLGSVYP